MLTELAERTGLTKALSEAMAVTRKRRSAHDPGVVLRDLAIAIADGGDCVSDLGVLRGQQALFGRIASQTTTHRVIRSIDKSVLEALRGARAKARERAWEAGARPSELILDIDATLLGSHSEKEHAAGNYKGCGFFPLLCYLDQTGEALAGLLRPGNAGANTAADHSEVLQLALEQIPAQDLDREILVRTDSAGGTHAFTSDCRDADIRFSVGYEVDARVREAILSLPDSAWQQAIEADGTQREGAWVAELGDRVDLSSWPEGTRLIVRRDAPTQAPSFASLTPRATATSPSSPTRKETTSPPWSAATAAGLGPRIRSAAPRTPGWQTCPSPSSPPTRSGSSSACSPMSCSAGPAPCAWRASSAWLSPSACASACCTSPGGWCAPPGKRRCGYHAPGPGPRRWSRHSRCCGRWS